MRLLKKSELRQFNKQMKEIHTPKCQIIFLLQGLENRANIGSLFRLAEAVGAQMWLCGKTITPPHPDLELTSKGQESRVDWKYFPQASEAIKQAKGIDYKILALEICQTSLPYQTYKYPHKICLVLGNEVTGVHNDILATCDDALFVPMFGKNLSLNVVVCTAIVTYRAILG